MINFLFLLATAHASDVYEIDCRETRVWSEREQEFVFGRRECGMMDETIYFMVHKNSLEINQKDIVPISSYTKNGFVEHRVWHRYWHQHWYWAMLAALVRVLSSTRIFERHVL